MSGETFPIDQVPAGSKHLYGTLFSVPFASLVMPDSEAEEVPNDTDYKFKNPRMLTERGQADLLDKRLSAELRESIRNRTQLNPFVCRWVKGDSGYYPLVVGGDRRYRALDFLIRKKEIVTDPRSVKLNDEGQWEYSQCPADEAYETVLCQCFAVNTDLDALALAWAENKGRVNLTEGHEIAEVMKLRKVGASDEKILEILQQDEKWLSESDQLVNNLDDTTLGDLLEGRITRTAAKEFVSIKDVAVREKVRLAANVEAQETCAKKIQRYQKQIEKALDQKEIAEGSIVDAEFNNDLAGIEAAKGEVVTADKKIKQAVTERDESQPVVTAKNVRKAADDLGAEIDDRPLRTLSAKKIKSGLEYLDNLIINDGICPEGSFIGNVVELRLVRSILNNNIMANESDFSVTIRRHVETYHEAQDAQDEELDE